MKRTLFLLLSILLSGFFLSSTFALSCQKTYEGGTFDHAKYLPSPSGKNEIQCIYFEDGSPIGGYVAGTPGTLIPSSPNWINMAYGKGCFKAFHPELCPFRKVSLLN